MVAPTPIPAAAPGLRPELWSGAAVSVLDVLRDDVELVGEPVVL